MKINDLNKINNYIDLFILRCNVQKQCVIICFELLKNYDFSISINTESSMDDRPLITTILIKQIKPPNFIIMTSINENGLIDISTHKYLWDSKSIGVKLDDFGDVLLSLIREYKILTKDEEIIRDIII